MHHAIYFIICFIHTDIQYLFKVRRKLEDIKINFKKITARGTDITTWSWDESIKLLL